MTCILSVFHNVSIDKFVFDYGKVKSVRSFVRNFPFKVSNINGFPLVGELPIHFSSKRKLRKLSYRLSYVKTPLKFRKIR